MGKKCISIVVPMYNEQESLQILYRELNRVTREMGDYDFEYLFVNDGSKDATLQKIRELAAEDERVHYLSFSRNFGKEAALLAGLSYAKGDYVTTMDADLQDPPSLLPEMLGCSQFMNSDEFTKSLSPFSPDAASIQAGKLMLLKMNYLFRRHEDFAIETTLATRSLKRMIDRAHEQGYTVTILYFWLNSPELAVERVRARVAAGGHNIPEPVIRRRYTAGLHYFFNVYKSMADRWILADNSQIPFRVVAEGQKNRLIIKDEETYMKIRQLAVEANNVIEEKQK